MDFCKRCGALLHDNDRFCASCGAKVSGAPSGGGDYSGAAKDAQNNKIMAILCYFGPLIFIPIFTAKNSPFVRFHANQGFTLFLAWLVSAVLDGIFWTFGSLLGIFVLILSIIGIINAAQGREQELPFIGGLRLVDQWFRNV
ncbi:MAG TPA: zinc-ribbon domain-containing protein [Clostridiales bacterium]|jgi:uncharacterized membrane protein|nr:zinc-ribbon domain-containing protein [Clostridiales bacterium]